MILATHGIIGSSGGVSYDVDAQAFITSANITDTTQKNAINQLVLDLKSANIWTKFKALYPFVGGTATTHKFNLKDPRDLDAAYRLVFAGGWTHSSTGALPNGTTGYANTNLIPSTVLSNINGHTSIYVNNTPSVYTSNPGFGAMDPNTGSNTLYTLLSFNNIYYSTYGNETLNVNFSNSVVSGFYTATRTSTSILKAFKNGILKATNSSLNSGTLPAYNYYYGAVNNTTPQTLQATYNNYNHAFASIGDGLTDIEASNFHTAVQTFQTTLGRQV